MKLEQELEPDFILFKQLESEWDSPFHFCVKLKSELGFLKKKVTRTKLELGLISELESKPSSFKNGTWNWILGSNYVWNQNPGSSIFLIKEPDTSTNTDSHYLNLNFILIVIRPLYCCEWNYF